MPGQEVAPKKAWKRSVLPAAPVRETPLIFPNRSEFARSCLTPRSLGGWLRFLWSRVLFPGSAPQGQGTWGQVLILIVLPAALLYPCMSFHLFEPDEGRYAQIPREMLERGDWIVPTLQGEPYLDKPPLFYWSVMLSFAAFGFHDWAARLIPALAVHGTVLLNFFLGRRFLGPTTAFWGSVCLILAPAFVGMGRMLILDGLLTFWTTLALYSALLAVRGLKLRWSWWLTCAAACGLGALTKGPIALILLLPPLWLYRRLTAPSAAIGWRGWAAFFGVVLAINAPWYVAASLRLPNFLEHFFWEHNVQRFLDPFDHERPLWFYAPVLLVGLLPVVLLLPACLRYLGSTREEAARRRPVELGCLLLAGLWCVLFFSLSGCKLMTYILPALPPLCLVFGGFLAHTSWGRSRITLGVTLAWSALLIVMHWGVTPWIARVRSPMGDAVAVAACCDPNTPLYCFPRPIDSVAFYLGRSDLRSFRSKNVDDLVRELSAQPTATVLFSHRHSSELLRSRLPSHLVMTRRAPLGLCDMAVIERR